MPNLADNKVVRRVPPQGQLKIHSVHSIKKCTLLLNLGISNIKSRANAICISAS